MLSIGIAPSAPKLVQTGSPPANAKRPQPLELRAFSLVAEACNQLNLLFDTPGMGLA